MFDKARDISSERVICNLSLGMYTDVGICYLLIIPEPGLSGVDVINHSSWRRRQPRHPDSHPSRPLFSENVRCVSSSLKHQFPPVEPPGTVHVETAHLSVLCHSCQRWDVLEVLPPRLAELRLYECALSAGSHVVSKPKDLKFRNFPTNHIEKCMCL